MNFNRNKPEVGSSRAFIERFYSSLNHNEHPSFAVDGPSLSPVSKVSSPSDKAATSNFSLMENPGFSPNQSEIKTNLIKKFEDFLENLRTDECINTEEDLISRFVQNQRSKTPENSTFVISRGHLPVESLMRKYENLMILNSELDLELINRNMGIRERKNKKIKEMLEIQREINDLEQEQRLAAEERDRRKGLLIELIRELKRNEEGVESLQYQLNEIMLERENEGKINQKNDDFEEKNREIERKKLVLAAIQAKNDEILYEIAEIEGKEGGNVLDLTEIRKEIMQKKTKIDGFEKVFKEIEGQIEGNRRETEAEKLKYKGEIEKVEDEAKNDEKNEILQVKYETPLKQLRNQITTKSQEKERFLRDFEDKIKLFSSEISEQQQRKNQNQTETKMKQEKNAILSEKNLEKLEISKKNLENAGFSINMIENELKTLRLSQEQIKASENESFLSISQRKSELFGFHSQLKSALEEQNKRKNELKAEKEATRYTLFKEKVDFLKDLRKRTACMKDMRNEISEQITTLSLEIKRLHSMFEAEKELNKENNQKNNDLGKEIDVLREKITNCSKENEAICGKFKQQIEENCGKEKEIKEIMEINEKLKVLTETQINEIGIFNERNNLFFKEIQLLEKGDLKEWNKYLKDKEKKEKTAKTKKK